MSMPMPRVRPDVCERDEGRPPTRMASSSNGKLLARNGPTTKPTTPNIFLARKRLPYYVTIFFSLQVLLMVNAVVSTGNQLCVSESATCQCWGDSSFLPSILQQCCNINTEFRPRARDLRNRPRGSRRGFHSPWLAIPRGGGGTNEKVNLAEHQQEPQQTTENSNLASQKRVALPLTSLPLIDTKSVSLALRLTCETNRRLHHGTSVEGGARSFISSRKSSAAASAKSRDDGNLGEQTQQGQHAHHHHPQQQMMMPAASNLPTIQSISEEELINDRRKEELTVFHAMVLWEKPTIREDENNVNATYNQSRAASGKEKAPASSTGGALQSWGPDLQSYLNTLLSAIGLDGNAYGGGDSKTVNSPMEDELQIILSLTLLYLDRSTSHDSLPLHVDPHTGQRQYFPPCPHVLPRTVHRMLLTALSIAAKCVRGDRSISNALCEAANSLLGEKCAISEVDLEQMENWMVHTLSGDSANGAHHQQHYSYWQVSQEELSSFMRKWGGTFYPQRLQAHDQSRMKQLERFWRDQTAAVFGAGQQQQHGHGNYYWPEKTGGGADQNHPPSLQYESVDNQWQAPGQQHSQDYQNMAEQQFYETSSEPF